MMHSWTLAKRENNNVKYSFLKEVILKKKKSRRYNMGHAMFYSGSSQISLPLNYSTFDLWLSWLKGMKQFQIYKSNN